MIAGLAIGLLVGFFLALALASVSRREDRLSAFKRGYCHGWYDGLNGVPEMDHEQKAELYVRSRLHIVGDRRHGSGTSGDAGSDGRSEP